MMIFELGQLSFHFSAGSGSSSQLCRDFCQLFIHVCQLLAALRLQLFVLSQLISQLFYCIIAIILLVV